MKALQLFQEYMGSGLIVIWYLIALVYLWIREKRSEMRIVFLYVPLLLLLLFFNPLVAQVFERLADSEIYYRILWLLPMTPTIAFATVQLCMGFTGWRRSVSALVAVAVMACSGSLIYANPYFERAENLYHVPEAVVEICDAIEVPGREVKAAFPEELIQYVRQYSPTVVLAFGRNVVVSSWSITNKLHDMMLQEEIDAQAFAAEARAEEVVYLVLPADQKLEGSLEDWEFEVFAEIAEYIIYKDSTVDLYYFLKE